MELTKKEGEILEFVKKYKVCKKEHVKQLLNITQVNKRIEHLKWQNYIKLRNNEVIEIKNNSLQLQEKENILKVLDVVSELHKKNRIDNIKIMDLPYYVMARSIKKNAYVYFTIVNKGKETIQLRLIDLENRGNTIIILEDYEQVKHLNMLKTNISKVIIYSKYK